MINTNSAYNTLTKLASYANPIKAMDKGFETAFDSVAHVMKFAQKLGKGGSSGWVRPATLAVGTPAMVLGSSMVHADEVGKEIHHKAKLRFAIQNILLKYKGSWVDAAQYLPTENKTILFVKAKTQQGQTNGYFVEFNHTNNKHQVFNLANLPAIDKDGSVTLAYKTRTGGVESSTINPKDKLGMDVKSTSKFQVMSNLVSHVQKKYPGVLCNYVAYSTAKNEVYALAKQPQEDGSHKDVLFTYNLKKQALASGYVKKNTSSRGTRTIVAESGDAARKVTMTVKIEKGDLKVKPNEFKLDWQLRSQPKLDNLAKFVKLNLEMDPIHAVFNPTNNTYFIVAKKGDKTFMVDFENQDNDMTTIIPVDKYTKHEKGGFAIDYKFKTSKDKEAARRIFSFKPGQKQSLTNKDGLITFNFNTDDFAIFKPDSKASPAIAAAVKKVTSTANDKKIKAGIYNVLKRNIVPKYGKPSYLIHSRQFNWTKFFIPVLDAEKKPVKVNGKQIFTMIHIDSLERPVVKTSRTYMTKDKDGTVTLGWDENVKDPRSQKVLGKKPVGIVVSDRIIMNSNVRMINRQFKYAGSAAYTPAKYVIQQDAKQIDAGLKDVGKKKAGVRDF